MCNINIGTNVPDFTMDAFDPAINEFTKVHLGAIMQQRKWLILFFYPADFTFVCPTELDDLASKHEELKSLGVEVVSVSTDTKHSHLAWHQTERLLKNVKYTMGTDPTGKISKMFGVYDEETGLAFRGTFIINPSGKLVASEINFNDVGRNADEFVRKVKANIHIALHPDEACPAKWEQGDKTLTPSAKLVGKVYEALH